MEPERARGGALRERELGAGKVEVESGAPGFRPERPAGIRQQPRRWDVVALGDPALGQHVLRAVGTRVAAVGPEPDAPPALVERQAVPGAKAGQALLVGGSPAGLEAEWLRVAPQLHQNLLRGRDRHAHVGRARTRGGAERDRRARVMRIVLDDRGGHRLQLAPGLLRDDALGDLDQALAAGAAAQPEPQVIHHRPPGPVDGDPQRIERDLNGESSPIEAHDPGIPLDRRGHAPTVAADPCLPVTSG